MKLKIYILFSVSAILAICQNSMACGPYWYYPADYIMPHLWDGSQASTLRSTGNGAVCEDWKAFTGDKSIRTEDIRAVVFGYSIEEMDKIRAVKSPSNTFAAWLAKPQNMDALDYMVMAKNCEVARSLQSSRWYYPSKDDPICCTLEEISEQCEKRSLEGGRLADRYALQTVRAMFSLMKYEEIDVFWGKVSGKLPDGVIKDMCLRYVAGAEFKLGREDKVLAYFASVGDLESVYFCLSKIRPEDMGMSALEYIARYCPNNPYASKIIQEFFDSELLTLESDPDYRKRLTEMKIDGKKGRNLCRICDIAVKNSACDNPAMWYYAKALSLDLMGESGTAWTELKKGAKSRGSDFIHNSIRVMDIYLAAKNSVYDSAYEKRLYTDLQWLDDMIVSNITDKVKEETINQHWHLSINVSYYYWNDMLRKILLGEVCPRMIDRGKPLLALRLANMADNRLLNVIGEWWETVGSYPNASKKVMTLQEYRESSQFFNYLDYGTAFFKMINNEVPLKVLEKYIASAGNSTVPIDRFLDERGYIEKSYLKEVAGTRCLRDRDYSSALKWLKSVPPSYQYRLNTSVYMDRDPFADYSERSCVQKSDYKLNFAREMAYCDEVIGGNNDPDAKGRAMIRKGLGLKASVTFAWPLTQYEKNARSEWVESDYTKKLIAEGENLVKAGLLMIKDKNVKADELYKLSYYRTVLEQYGDTDAARTIRLCCDKYADYEANKSQAGGGK